MEKKHRKLDKKFREKIKHVILSRMKNNRIECSSQILEEYKKYYENVLN